MKPELKAHGTNVLTLKCHEPLSTIAFTFNLRRYIEAYTRVTQAELKYQNAASGYTVQGSKDFLADVEKDRIAVSEDAAGPETWSLFSSSCFIKCQPSQLPGCGSVPEATHVITI
jgi:hypothetical protein